ncbi:MAG TPA: hypothetical protein VGZ47_20120 [Gemmataceae bacterium]|jgi:hypothetical protein|nr:hypothetical protein [Gemmataceae bacterium]
MTGKPNLKHFGHEIRVLSESAPPPAEPAPDREPRELARELIQAFEDELIKYRRIKERDPERADPSQPPPDWLLEGIRGKPAQDVTFFDLERLARIDPAEAAQRWQEVKETARQDITGGEHAARALEFMGGSAWERACFLAIREQLHAAWPPRSAGEALLLDEMAQYELTRRKWIGVVSMRSQQPETLVSLERRGEREEPRRQSAADATLEAMRMVERLQRLYHNALRMLLSLRRGKPQVIVRKAAQVNLAAGPQMNLHVEAERDSDGRSDVPLMPQNARCR